MGLIKEPTNVDFTVISKAWTADEEREFSELIKQQKGMLNKKSVYIPAGSHFISARHSTLRKKKIIA